ncbi:MAG: phosphoadenylyl-sulfate reductase [Chloroflexi bacterium]|nr:phosphoadenylyl-sulfate reductase [Chloroflexota bacterium]
MTSSLNLPEISKVFESTTPQDILSWAGKEFNPKLTISSSFQTQSVPLLHFVSQTIPDTPVLFVDTGYHFPGTLEFRDHLTKLFKLNLVIVKPKLTKKEFEEQFGLIQYKDPDTCCLENKVKPIQEALKGFDAWISGIRRDQTPQRSQIPIISQSPFQSIYKICPLANWTIQDVQRYILDNNLPQHPLQDHGFKSIGCYPCTDPVLNGQNERSGRWAWTDKTECGLHIQFGKN